MTGPLPPGVSASGILRLSPRNPLRPRSSLFSVRDHVDQPEDEQDESDGQSDHAVPTPLDLPEFRWSKALSPARQANQILVVEVRLEARDGMIPVLGIPLHRMKDDLLKDRGNLGPDLSGGDRIPAQP